MVFCRYCGRQLEDGELCTCKRAQQDVAETAKAVEKADAVETDDASKAVAVTEVEEAAEASPSQQGVGNTMSPAVAQSAIIIAIKKIVPYLKQFFSDPGKAIRDVIQSEDTMLAITMTLIRALSMGLAIFGLLRSICKVIGTSSDKLSYYLDGNKLKVSASFSHSMLYGILIGLLGMALFTIVVFLIARVQKSSATFKSTYYATSANSIMMTLLLLCTFLLSFISVEVCLICFVLAIISWPIFELPAAQVLCERQSELFWTCYLVGVLLIFFIGWKTMPSLFLNAVGETKLTVNGNVKVLSSMIDELKDAIGATDFSFKELLDELIGELADSIVYQLF